MVDVITCILENDGDILILKRSRKVGTYKGLWGGVAGFVEQNEEVYDAALKEIKEEVGIDKNDVFLIKKSSAIKFTDIYDDKLYNWVVHPFLFHIKDRDIVKIDWEHTEFKWIKPSDIKRFNTVPHFIDVVFKFFL
jgi:8-oxo-dGTP pyrophosphatase MutT (NUDIX family)